MAKTIDQYTLEDALHTDAYGFAVYRAKHIKSGELYTIRNVSIDDFNSQQFYQPAVTNEVSMHKLVCHANLINFVKMLKTAKNYYLVYEWCGDGNLLEKTQGGLTDTLENNYIKQLVLAVREMHKCGVAHLALHPATVLLAAGDLIKISNLAHAREVAKGALAEFQAKVVRFSQMLAPEQVAKGKAGLASDIYSLGRIIGFIKYGKIEHEMSLAEALKSKDPLAEVLQSMTQKQPGKRPEIDTVRTQITQALSKRAMGSPSPLSVITSSARDTNRPRKDSDERSTTPRKYSAMENSSREISIVTSTKPSYLELPSPGTKTAVGSERERSSSKSVSDVEGADKAIDSEVKRLFRERNKYYFLMMTASDLNSMNLHPSSSKLSYLLSKKAYLLGKKLQESLQSNLKGKAAQWQEVQKVSRILQQEFSSVEQFFKQLQEAIRRNDKKLLGDSAFELEVEEDDILNEVFLRKLLREYLGAVFPMVDLSSRDPSKSHKILQHLNNLSDVQTLDMFFSTYMNSSKLNLLDQVYFAEIERMELRDLHRFLSQKIV